MKKTYILLGLVVIAIGAGALFMVLTGSSQPDGTTKVEPRAQAPETATSTDGAETGKSATETPVDPASRVDTSPTSTETSTVNIPKNPTQSVEKTYTLAEVALHNTPGSCWSAVNGAVYDLTGAIEKHPGGPEAIKKICGTDGTSLFTKQHGGQEKPNMFLTSLKIGVLVQ